MQTGKAFEYACAYVLGKQCAKYTAVYLANSPQMNIAKSAFRNLSEDERRKYLTSAAAAVKIIDRLEPKLSQTALPTRIGLQPDSQGVAGDVRDVICAQGSDWVIGLSCKHNHEAVKHSRLSDTIDFGHDWFGKSCSRTYFDDVRRVFTPLRKVRDAGLASGRPKRWSDMADKEGEAYVPVLRAFMEELKRLDGQYPGEIPALLIRYLIGRHDFYKVIMDEMRGCTRIEAVNINGTLNQADGERRAFTQTPRLKLPAKFYEIAFENGSRSTIHVACDEGWQVSMRIHNASAVIEPSLKFDVRLLSAPHEMPVYTELWEKRSVVL